MLPYYLSIGMSYDLFWFGDPAAVRFYREADRLSYKKTDFNLWLQGRYVYDAMLSAAPLFMTFAKNHRPRDYNKKSYTELAEDEKRQKSRAQQLKNGEWVAKHIAAQLSAWESEHPDTEDN